MVRHTVQVVLLKCNAFCRSHATYHFLAAGKFYFFVQYQFITRTLGCYIAIGKLDEGQRLLDDIPYLVGKKVAGKAPPTEVFLKKKSTLSVDTVLAS